MHHNGMVDKIGNVSYKVKYSLGVAVQKSAIHVFVTSVFYTSLLLLVISYNV